MGSDGHGFRLMSANLSNGGASPRVLAELVETLAPDVVAVQELAPEQADVLARLLPHGLLEPRRDHHGMGVALRWPARVWRVPLAYRDARVAELTLNGTPGRTEPVEIVNVHIAAPHVQPLRRAMGLRRDQIRGLLGYLDASRRRRAVVGDFNATPLWPVYRRLRRRFGDAADDAARRAGRRASPTWGPSPGSPRLLRIDHVLVHGLRGHDARVLPLPGSDHSALVVDLALDPPA